MNVPQNAKPTLAGEKPPLDKQPLKDPQPASLLLVWYRYPLLWLLIPLLVGNRLGAQLGTSLDAPMMDVLAWLSLAVVGAVLYLAYRLSSRSAAALQLATLHSATSLLGTQFPSAKHPAYQTTIGAMPAIIAALGVGLSQALWQTPPEADGLSPFATREAAAIAIEGTIASAAEWRPNLNHRPDQAGSSEWLTTWSIDCSAVRERDWRPLRARSTLTVPGRIHDLFPGDHVRVFGTFRAISEPTNPGAYDFASHSRTEGRFVRLNANRREQVEVVGFRPQYLPSRCRAVAVMHVDKNLRRWVAWDQSALAAALIFGQRSQVDWEERQELMATGTLHLLAISGLHVAIVASAVFLLCKLLHLPNRVQFWAVAGCCVLYAALAGGQPPVLRAVVLVSLIGLSRTWGRTGRLTNLLCGAAILLLFIDAHNAVDVGVHLSFLAVGSIGLFSVPVGKRSVRRDAVQELIDQRMPLFPRWFRRISLNTWAGLRISGWVWLMTCPLIWSSFHVVSPIAVPLNVLVAMPLTISLLTGLLAGLLGAVPVLAAPLGWISGSCLALISGIVNLGNRVPFGHWWLPAPPAWWSWVFYVVVIVWLLILGTRYRGLLATLLVGWLAFGIGMYSTGPRGYLTAGSLDEQTSVEADQPDQELRVTFLDVGHGTSVLIEFPEGPVWLYDAGRFGAMETSFQDIATALWSVPTARIDTLIVSHADSDHYNAVPGLLDRFNVGRVASTDRFWASDAGDVQHVHRSIRRAGIEVEAWSAGKSGNVGQVNWSVLHPRDGQRAESDNASSLCLLLQYGSRNLFLPGDLEGTGMLDLTSMPPRPCHVLMAPHHGSLSHDPRYILDWCVPEMIVISGNQRAIRNEVLERYEVTGATVAVTFRDGATQIRINQAGEISRLRWSDQDWVPL